MRTTQPPKRSLNRFAIVLDTLMATHNLEEATLLKAIGKRRDAKAMKSIRNWRTGRSRPRAGKYLNLLEDLEAKLSLPIGRLNNLAGGRSSVFYRAVRNTNDNRKDLIRWHMPENFDLRPEVERQEIMDWITANVLPCATAFGRYQSKSTRKKFSVVFPTLPTALGGRRWMGDQLRNRALKQQFLTHGTVPAPPRLTQEVEKAIQFHVALLPPKGFRRRKRWSRTTARMEVGRYGHVFGALAASPDRHVRGLGIPLENLTLALLVFPNVWEWYLQWCFRRRGFFSTSEINIIYDVKHLTRKPTGWLRQHPMLAKRLQPVPGLISQIDIRRVRANWDRACDRAFEYAAARLTEVREVARMHRDPFAPILPVLTSQSPLAEYKKIGDEMLRRLPDERRPDDRRRLLSESTAVRNYLMFRFALHLGLRQRNLRELLLCPIKQKHRDTVTLEGLERGELRWKSEDRVWEVIVPAAAIKNGAAAFFRGRPYVATLPNLNRLYYWIDCYLREHRSRLLNGHEDPGTFFVRSMREGGHHTELNITSFYSVWKLIIQKYGIYNPYTGRGAIKGLLPHGPHAARDVLATHLLKTTGSYELASYAIQDSVESVMKHYARFMPHEKVARAAEELNKVWRE